MKDSDMNQLARAMAQAMQKLEAREGRNSAKKDSLLSDECRREDQAHIAAMTKPRGGRYMGEAGRSWGEHFNAEEK